VAVNDGSVVGILIFVDLYDATMGVMGIEISHLFVEESSRRKSIGTRMTDFILRSANKNDYKFCRISVRNWNEEAGNFYFGLGFYSNEDDLYKNTECYHDLTLFREEFN